MKNILSRCISIVISSLLIFTMIMAHIPRVYAVGEHSLYSECNKQEFANQTRFDEIKSQLPIGTQITNAKGLYFNLKLWHDKKIVVYGNHDSIKNDFMEGYQLEGEDTVRAGGYYKGIIKGAEKIGEYRYHGQDAMGNSYTNVRFRNAFKIGDLESNRWVYLPWENQIVTKERPRRSDYNEDAYYGNTKTQEWIGKTTRKFNIEHGIHTDGQPLPSRILRGNVQINPYNEPWNFIHVLTPPTATHPGEGRMWHKKEGGIRYQTFSIEKVNKQPTNVDFKLELITPQAELNIIDSNDVVVTNALIPVKIRITATLKDEDYYNDLTEKVNHYTRDDIAGHNVTVAGSVIPDMSRQFNKVYKTEHTLYYTVSEIKASNYKIDIMGAAYFLYKDDSISSTCNYKLPVSFTKEKAPEPPPVQAELLPNIPDKWYDIVEFPASDGTDLTDIIDRQVYINAVQIEAEEFFDGQYIFGESRVGLNHIRMVWITRDGQELEAARWTVIYSTKPKAEYRLSGSHIQNRKMTVNDNSANSNLAFVLNRYPITNYQWTFREVSAEEGSLKRKDVSTTVKDFLCKKPGTFEIGLVVTNSLGRTSDPYVVTFTIFEDYPAAVITNLNNSVLARNEQISAYDYDVVSTDGDTIASNTLELWYDSDNNETYDQLLQTWNNVATFPTYTPTKLGKYKFVNKITEEFGHPTIPEFVAPEDRKSITVEREFWVDNYIPMTGIYVDIPIVRPEIDMFFMLDQNLKPASSAWIKDNRMNISNNMRLSNIIAKVDNWDLKTYEYTQPASTTSYTGSAYPPAVIAHTSNGYSGTLNRTGISDNGSYQDYGSYRTTTESQYFSDSWSNHGTMTFNDKGQQTGISWSSPAPGSIYISSDGFSGSIPRTSTSSGSWYATSYHSNGKVATQECDWTAYYGGTLTRTVQVWVPNLQWAPSYTGYYSGTLYKYMKQPYSAPFVTTHKKYVIYVSDSSIANQTDLRMLRDNNDVDIILIGGAAAQSQSDYDYFILNDGSSIEVLVDRASQWIVEQNPVPEEDIITTQNTVFVMNEADYDQEGDLLINRFYQYIHNKDYYDNPTGQEPLAQTAYSNHTGWTGTKKDRFANVGLYTIYRRIQDQPTADANFSEYNKLSNVPSLKVAVHRIPIAQPAMTWRYNASSSLYQLTFLDASYDLDHQYSRPDKGIIDTSMRYRKAGGEWNYKMPTDLEWGNYTIEYLVKDVELTWSSPYVMNISLSQVPPANIVIDSMVLQKDMRMQGDNTIPAAEVLQITSTDRLTGPIIRSNVPVSSAQVLINGASIGTLTLTSQPSLTEYVYTTNIFEYTIPADYADGSLHVTVRATSNMGSQLKDNHHTITVYTPIWESYSGGSLSYISNALRGIPEQIELSPNNAHEKLNNFKAITSKYTSKIQVSIGGITYYIFKNGTIGTSLSGSGAAATVTFSSSSLEYKVTGLAIRTTADCREWSFKLSVVNGKPLRLNTPYSISITGYDEAGNAHTTSNKHGYNPQTKSVIPNNYLLYNFRIAMVREFGLAAYYKNFLPQQNLLQYTDRPMYVNSMAIDSTSFGGMVDGLTKGYKFEFEIDSRNFNDSTDQIIIEPHFYTADAISRDAEERDIYWEDSNHKIYRAGEGGHEGWKTIVLNSGNRSISSESDATWRGEYLIPGSSWAVPKGTTAAQAKGRNLKRDIVVNFHIKGYKNGVLQFDYNLEQWGKERTINKFPYQIGDVIKYSWNKNCLDDIKAIDNR